jgi:dTDP-4-amino-4,6-dideoxygalactose transaminase
VSRLYLSPPDVGEAEREALLRAFDSNWIAPLGPEVDAFEAEFAAYHSIDNAVALSSGTAGLHLALVLLGVGPGDEVIVPTFTFAASAFATTYVGAEPVFLDSDHESWNLDPELLAAELADRAARGRLPAAVIAVDLYGQTADYEPIATTCAEHGVPLIEDAAEALGASYHGRAAGTLGDLGVFSFNGNKIITTSGGGMLVARDAALADQARNLAAQARDPALHYEHSQLGFNYRLSNLLAALGRAQLAGLDTKVARRRQIKQRYRDAFADVPAIAFMPDAAFGEPTNWLTVITLDSERCAVTPHEICTHLETLDIEARPAWKPMHLQPVFADCSVRGGAVAERIFTTGVCLPSGSSMTEADVERVAEAVLTALRRPA